MAPGLLLLVFRIVVIMCLGKTWKVAGIPLIHQPDETLTLPTSSSPSQDLSNNEDKIQLCGDRLREMIKLICKHQGSTQLQYYTPEEPPSDRNDEQGQGITENLDRMENEVIGHRHRRQVVRECCDKPCFKRDLLKYCNPMTPSTSTELSLQPTTINSQNSRRRRRGGRQKWRNENVIAAIREDANDNEIQKDEPFQPKAAPCRCPNKERRKASGNEQLLPPAYLPYQMLFIPYDNNIPPLGSTNVGGTSERSATEAFLQSSLNDEPPNSIPHRNSWQTSFILPLPKRPRHTIQNPLFQQRALVSMNSDEVDSTYETNELSSNYRRYQRNEPLRSLVRMVTDTPFSPEDPIAFPRGTNDH